MRILGIETSCDDTGAALYHAERGLQAHALYSQVVVHRPYGGIVPELAARDHVQKLLPVVEEVLAGGRADAVAYTAGPGLTGALLVGAAVAQGLARAWRVPCLGVHHMEGHLLAPMLEDEAPDFPFLALLVSGGHTLLADVEGVGRYRILGESLDDAVGEAFDKTAKLLNLGYPGGPPLARAAETGRADRFHFPRPMTDRPGLDFSFSGLKTCVLNTVRAHEPLDARTVADICAAFQEAVVDTLVIKCRRAWRVTGRSRLVVAGGVGANARLRAALKGAAAAEGVRVYYPRQAFCTDNGAMIAYLGYRRLADARPAGSFSVRPRWPLAELAPPAS